MPTLSVTITDDEASAVLEITNVDAATYLERQVRTYVADCVQRLKAKVLQKEGLPTALATLPLDARTIDAIRAMKRLERAKNEAEVEAATADLAIISAEKETAARAALVK